MRGRLDGRSSGQAGFSLPELLLSAALLGVLAAVSFGSGAELLARQRVEATTRLILEGIQKARAEAERQGQACALSLGEQGWQSPADPNLPACQLALLDLGELHQRSQEGQVEWASNLPASLRFSANGLVIDGGTVVIWSERTALRRCLVMAPPLGVLRHGRYSGDLTQPDAASCLRENAA